MLAVYLDVLIQHETFSTLLRIQCQSPAALASDRHRSVAFSTQTSSQSDLGVTSPKVTPRSLRVGLPHRLLLRWKYEVKVPNPEVRQELREGVFECLR